MSKYSNTEVRRPPVAAALQATRNAIGSVALLSAFTNILMLTGPLFMMQVYDRVLSSRSVPTLVALSMLAIVLYLFLGILELIRSRILSRIGERIEEQLGGPTFDAVMLLPLRMSKKEVAAQPVRDLEHMRQFMSGPGPVAICDMPWLPLYIGILFLFHAYLGWLAIAGATLLIVLTLCSDAVLRDPTRRVAALSSTRADYMEAGRRNAEALYAMGMKGAYARKWHETNAAYVEEQRRASDATSSFSTFSKIFRLALQSAVLALGAWLAIKQLASPGAMIASSILTSRALAPIEQAIGQWRGFVNFRQAKARLGQLLDKIGPSEDRMALPAPSKTLSVSSVAVVAPGNQSPTVRDVTFSLTAGQGLGIIGPSGSGKSTLVRALVGIWPPARGTVRLDGAEIDQWHPEALGPSIGYLPQGVELFDGTIAENISRFSGTANPSDIIEAARQADVHELILSMPEGYDTRIGNGGASLSAGQRQRIGLARALFGEPFLIVLDEPNASLDAEGEMALTNAIVVARQRGAIVVIVAHRPNALSAVDNVLVLAQGAMVAFGPRDEVLRKTTMRAVSEKA
ncbi:putative ABC transporter family, HlyB subfamily; putative protease secretion (ATP-binding protein) [Agrobacterium fabacearum CFBP 5771]|uniref:type I secretion system permease/ATPase n=1 Tax=Agrobacterium tumefaciens TaxID=358 RepID=UPI0009BBEFAE|nr:type I secretion system permease/ATPase [Agrobacterium tumefaciens]CVI17464.1 putative ABC transporter family, HlyB subfamily; putative protease secretion (ATP-binding protein) [Agrobacterium fabacearum CFBP 5771]